MAVVYSARNAACNLRPKPVTFRKYYTPQTINYKLVLRSEMCFWFNPQPPEGAKAFGELAPFRGLGVII